MTQILAEKIRRHAIRMVHLARASHIGSALSISDILAVLYGDILNYDHKNPLDSERDRFILSKGHACVALYAVLAESGFYEASDLETYGNDYSKFMNHVSHSVPGVEFSTGSLGHGLPYGVGKALAGKISQLTFRTYVLLSDGELDEGSNWEALLFAAHHGLDALVAIVDYNKLQSLTTVSGTLGLEPLVDKFRAFGCDVIEVDGHDHAQLKLAFSARYPGKPLVVIAHTTKGKGISFMENKVEWHYRSPNQEEMMIALSELEFYHA